MTRVVVGSGTTRVVVAGGAPTQIRLDRATVARVEGVRQRTVPVTAPAPVQVELRSTFVHAGGAMGVQGPPGPSGTGDITATAGAPLSALRVVKVVGGVAAYADSATSTDAGLLTGITFTAAATGASITLRTDGELVDATWSWSPGPIYCGTNGVLTQVPPTSGFLCEVARAINATSILVDVQNPIIRS